jgi:hypothetical protein
LSKKEKGLSSDIWCAARFQRFQDGLIEDFQAMQDLTSLIFREVTEHLREKILEVIS